MINVFEITGETAIRQDLADRLFAILYLEITTNYQATIVDFSGVDFALCLFLHVAIGRLYNEFPAMVLDRKLRIVGMNENIRDVCDRCRESWV
ncbi:STAS-like domain-containing protein [Phormidium tenue]|uniref:STAS-like domain-containing protein n=1 Tax=Phormidium tenue FACHB-1050 TaxID=2692857 RepID=A0ABR8C7D0_9CYAN|nr:STAS-like domain-containing protein [Phormidium tenue]MBD2316683.1 STAS-like domain-containing protein [Phormidium tenue FACHB-1050]